MILWNPPQIFPWWTNLFCIGLSKVTFCMKIQLWQPVCSLVCQRNKGYKLMQLVCLSPTKDRWAGWLLVTYSCGIQAGTDSQFSHHELEMQEITSSDRCNCSLQGAGKKVVCTMCPVADRMADTAFLAELLLRFDPFSLIKGFLLKFFAWAWLGIMKTEKPLFNKAVLLYCY